MVSRVAVACAADVIDTAVRMNSALKMGALTIFIMDPFLSRFSLMRSLGDFLKNSKFEYLGSKKWIGMRFAEAHAPPIS
jgi:hypothetical protein